MKMATSFLVLVVSSAMALQAAAENLSVKLENSNTSMQIDDIEVYDRVCGRQVGVFRLRGGTSVMITLCADASGKGSVKIRHQDNDWVGIDYIRPGDRISR